MNPMKTLVLNGQEFEIWDEVARNSAGGDKHYVYTQATPSALWTVTHNLGKIPAITVIDSAGTEVEGTYTHPDENTTILEFSGAFSGTAYFN